jgi:hypothetical protein
MLFKAAQLLVGFGVERRDPYMREERAADQSVIQTVATRQQDLTN